MRGISLPIETTVVIVLAAIVLVALLLFFSGTFSPGAERIKLEQRKVDLCTKYVAQDSTCRISASADLQDVCKKLDTPNARVCCSAYCPAIETATQCTVAGGTCDDVECSTTTNKNEIGKCSDDTVNPHCCAP